MSRPKLSTVGELLYWSYANLAMMDAALQDGVARPGKTHFMIRSRLYRGLCLGTMQIGSFFEDERLKLILPKACCYCGSRKRLSADHVIPQKREGGHGGENLIYSCRRCNSSKGSSDLLVWMARRGQFPPLYVLRRYLKMAIEYCREHELMGHPVDRASEIQGQLPFDLALIPVDYPPTNQLRMFVAQPQAEEGEPLS